MGRNLSLRGSRWILQPDNLRLGMGYWVLGMGYSPCLLSPQSTIPTLLMTTDIERVNLCEF
jgi:hypothetical protein